MKGWSTLFFVVGIIMVILSLLSIMTMNLVAIFGLLIAALPYFFLSKLCNVITDMRAAQDESLTNQKRLLIMVDNLKED